MTEVIQLTGKKTVVSLDELTLKRLDEIQKAKKTINRPETIRYLLNFFEESQIDFTQ